MRVVVAYESMFGNTRAVAQAIAAGIAPRIPVDVIPVAELTASAFSPGDFLVIGAPTHVHGLPRKQSRQAAAEMQAKDASLTLDPRARDRGVREWLATAGLRGVHSAAFDTRAHGPRIFTGSAAQIIARRLRRGGAHLVDSPHSFLVVGSTLMPGELDRARAWGAQLALLAPSRMMGVSHQGT